jgi:cell division septal protein FtsQ
LTLVRLPKNISLGHIDVRRCQARLLQCPQILEAHVERVYPNVLRVKLVERVPAFKLRSGAGWAFVSPDGVIFEGRGIPETTTQRLPQLEGTFTGSATLSFLPELYRAFAAFQRKSPAIVETWKSIEVDEKAYATMGYLDGFTVKSNPIHRLVLCTGDPQRQLEELKYVLAEAQARRQLPLERVDLSIPGRAYVTPRRGP